jgi:deoxyribonuclease-4
MHQFGLKLWSTNKMYYDEALRLFSRGVFNYVELYVVPDSYEEYINIWKSAKKDRGISFVIHAPHYKDGMNLANKASEKKNIALSKQAFAYADALSADIVIFHPGIAGDEKETARQLKTLYDQRIVIENKPYYTIDGKQVCNGYSPEQIKMIIDESSVGFCFDIAHAICAANSRKHSPYAYLKPFLDLKPRILHLTDGETNSGIDQHRHFGKGNYDIKRILSLLRKNGMITIETVKDSANDLNDYVRDINIIKNY